MNADEYVDNEFLSAFTGSPTFIPPPVDDEPLGTLNAAPGVTGHVTRAALPTDFDLLAGLRDMFRRYETEPYRPPLRISPTMWFGTQQDVDHDRVDACPETLRDTIRQISEQVFEKVEAAAVEARKAGCDVCVHESDISADGPSDLFRDVSVLTVRVRAHLLWPGQECLAAAPGMTEFDQR